MDYENKYKEVLERENERIRYGLIGLLKFALKDGSAIAPGCDVTKEQALVWLEKQGNTNEIINNDEFAQGVLRGAAISLITWIDYNAAEGNTCLSNIECKDIQDALVKGDWNKIYAYMKKKLERQDEQKHIFDFNANNWYVSKVDGKIHNIYNSEVEPKFKVGDWIINKSHDICLITDIDLENGYYICESNRFGNTDGDIDLVDKAFHLWSIKDAKDGDVLAFEDDSYILLVKELHSTIYGMRVSCYCHVLNEKFEVAEYQIRINGLYPATKEQHVLLFAKMREAGYEWDVNKKELKKIEDEEYDEEDCGIDGIWVAQSILEKTLGKVDGYQSDDGILEHKCAISAVKKLYRQKSTWSEEDKHRLEDTIYFLNTAKNHYASTVELDACIDWLKSLKKRMGV